MTRSLLQFHVPPAFVIFETVMKLRHNVIRNILYTCKFVLYALLGPSSVMLVLILETPTFTISLIFINNNLDKHLSTLGKYN